MLIDDLTVAAKEAVEQAAAQATKAAALASLEKEAAALAEAQQRRNEAQAVKRNGVKNAVIAGVICFFGGYAIGAGTFFIFGGR